jgi:hypothetical protein
MVGVKAERVSKRKIKDQRRRDVIALVQKSSRYRRIEQQKS